MFFLIENKNKIYEDRMNRRKIINAAVLILLVMMFNGNSDAKEIHRYGTTAANFLELGLGGDGIAMGDAQVSIPGRLSSIYWNPAGLAYLEHNQALFMLQPWVVDIDYSAAVAAYVNPYIGTLAFGIYQVNYGDMDVTTLDMQDGTGELFTATDFCFSVSYSRKLAQWFAFGANAKYIGSKIWHESASAMAVDLGVLVTTNFFSPSGKQNDALKIGMSISNYGTKMRYDGLDLTFPIDMSEREAGNFSDAPGQYKCREWELPLIFRFGISLNPIVNRFSKLTIAIDALHPNNNSEYINVGSEFELKLPGTGSLFIRAGQKGLLMVNNQFGPTFGGGIKMNFLGNVGMKIDYALRDIGILGYSHSYTFGLLF